MRIHLKTTYWESYDIPDDFSEEELEELKKDIEADHVMGYGDITDHLGDVEMDRDTFLETCDYLSPVHNQGQSTVELCDDDGNIIAQNANNDG